MSVRASMLLQKGRQGRRLGRCDGVFVFVVVSPQGSGNGRWHMNGRRRGRLVYAPKLESSLSLLRRRSAWFTKKNVLLAEVMKGLDSGQRQIHDTHWNPKVLLLLLLLLLLFLGGSLGVLGCCCWRESQDKGHDWGHEQCSMHDVTKEV